MPVAGVPYCVNCLSRDIEFIDFLGENLELFSDLGLDL